MPAFPDNTAFVCVTSEEDSDDLYLQRHLRTSEAGSDLLSFLAQNFPYHPRERWSELIRCHLVTVNGESGQAGQILSSGDLLSYHLTSHSEPEVPRYHEPVFQTDELLLVGKPAGIPITRTGLIVRSTFVNLLRKHYGDDLHPLHRLDRETSGLVLCAKGSAACRKYQNLPTPYVTSKYYLAIVHGSFPPGMTCAEHPLATREGGAIRCQMWPELSGKPCRTKFHTLATADSYSLVLAELLTGRRHQIRAHVAHLGYPVIGDKIYSHNGYYFLKRLTGELDHKDYRELGARNQTLHAWALRLTPPGGQEKLCFSQIFSEDFRRLLRYFPNWEKFARAKLTEICATPVP